jgi:L,D-transpeptidase YcbB
MGMSLPNPARSQTLHYPALVNKFYGINSQLAFWISSPVSFAEVKNYFINVLDSSDNMGLDKEKYHYAYIKNDLPKDSIQLVRYGRTFADGVITYCKDIYQGEDVSRWLNNDEVSGKYEATDNDLLLSKLAKINSAAALREMLASLEPSDKEYILLKEEYKKQLEANNKRHVEELEASVNLYRWIHHFHFDRYILVNIPSATLRYYEKDETKLQMKVVVGKPATRSPRFSSWCYQVVLYPYWNVPRKIAINELLPHFRKNPASLETMNMQVIGNKGEIIDPNTINWSDYSGADFPYAFRQCTGCENSLGVIKFNLTDPFDVYLHDTNFKVAFLKDTRFLSHGCIRVEKPIELANYLLENKLDSDFLKACYKDLKPMPNNLDKRVPVFVVYMPAEAGDESVTYFKDIYQLF